MESRRGIARNTEKTLAGYRDTGSRDEGGMSAEGSN